MAPSRTRGGSTLVLWVLLLAAVLPSASRAQRRDDTFAADWAALVALAPGDKVRVWIRRQARVTGILTEYYASDSLSIERSPDFFHLSPTRHYDLYWIDVQRIDVPHGRDLLGGTLGGVGMAVGIGTVISLGCTAAGGQHCGVAHWSVRAAPLAIPAGFVWGLFSTRWKRVY